MKRTCNGLTHSGQPCRAPAMPGDSRCISHSEDPKVRTLKRQATSKGGRMSTAWKPVRRGQMRRIEDVVCLLEEVTRKCAAGELPPRVASAVASASGQMLKGLETLALKDRLEALEKAILENRPYQPMGGV